VETFHLILIKPSHYDDDGYPIQWLRGFMPSNSLACVRGLALDSARRRVLGDDVEIEVSAIDETNQGLNPRRIIRRIERAGGKGMVGLVGVQTNQFPRALDLANIFRAAGLPVCMGGFHVAGTMSMLGELPSEVIEAQQRGIGFFLGEAEELRFDEVVRDAYDDALKPLYNHLDALPGLEGAPTPVLDRDHVARTSSQYSAFDLGRGCPYLCSFCTIINVQGHKSRFRSADDLERIVRDNHARGIDRFFITDDNLARNANWKECFDRLIELREKEGLAVRLLAQVDTQCHRIDGFIDKAVAAGVDQVFIGMESIVPENLTAVRKRQNRIAHYRKMLLAWKKHPVVITAGYIIGLPHDTKASICRDIETIKRELPIDTMYFTLLTPLPGCEDHKKLIDEGAWMDSDLNRYDLNHVVTHHPKMSRREWEEAYLEAWRRFYTFEHMETIFRRMTALGSNKKLTTLHRLLWYSEYGRRDGVHPLERGHFRIKSRLARRPNLPRENPVVFYPKYGLELVQAAYGTARNYIKLRRMLGKIWNDPKRREYRDEAITPVRESEAMPIWKQAPANDAAASA
jgi:hypothetical protein